MSSQVVTDIKNYQDIHIIIDLPSVIFKPANASLEKDHRGTVVKRTTRISRQSLPSGFDYGVFQEDIPEGMFNIDDIRYLLHPRQKANWEVVIRRMRFPQYKFIELQNMVDKEGVGYYTRLMNLVIGAGCRHINPPADLSEESEEMKESEKMNIASAFAKEQEREKIAKQPFKVEKKKWSAYKVPQLKMFARSASLPGYSKMGKDDLVKLLTEHYDNECNPQE
jgi:hypothetical protein